MDFDLHEIPESSAFFQGHPEQFFTKGKVSFKVIRNFDDMGESAKFNVEKYRPIFSNIIRQKIRIRNQGGGSLPNVNPKDLEIKYIKLVDDSKEEGDSGSYRIFPQGALCTKDGCYEYFDLSKGRTCGHKFGDPWEQVSFLAFCDVCGRLLPLHFMSNLTNDCKDCGEKNGLTKLTWKRKDDISSFKVRCRKCGSVKSLFFYECDHTIHKTNEKLSEADRKKFRGVPARAGAIVHPVVESFADIPQRDELEKTGKRNTNANFLSEAFATFFNEDLKESMLYRPEFIEDIKKNSEFWNLPEVKSNAIKYDIDLDDFSNLLESDLLQLIKLLIRNAKVFLKPDQSNKGKLTILNGLDKIEESLNKFKDLPFDEHDMQGLFLSRASSSEGLSVRNAPRASPINHADWNKKYGLKEIKHSSNLNIVQALLGIVEGSTRKRNPLFRPILTGKQEKPTVYVREFQTEGLLFQLDEKRILEWINYNKASIDPSMNTLRINNDARTVLRKLVQTNERCREAVEKLLHSYSHLLIQESTIDTGLDISSLSEIIYPLSASFFIYSTNTINIGGLEFTFDFQLEDWFKRLIDLATDCPQDPACMIDEGGACNACSYVPEFVCSNFNENLDRSTLIGTSVRFPIGYWK